MTITDIFMRWSAAATGNKMLYYYIKFDMIEHKEHSQEGIR